MHEKRTESKIIVWMGSNHKALLSTQSIRRGCPFCKSLFLSQGNSRPGTFPFGVMLNVLHEKIMMCFLTFLCALVWKMIDRASN